MENAMCRFTYTIDVESLRDMWADLTYTQSDVCRAFGLTRRQLDDAVERYALGARGRATRTNSMEDATPEEDEASGESLALSPWVQARIRELRIGFPQEATA